MKRQIFIVDAHIVDATGAFNYLEGYPKRFDSIHYNNDVDKAQIRAIGDASDVFGAMCKIDTRQQQVVIVSTSDGFIVDKRILGAIADVPQT
jgi:hypothetical protein